MTRDEVAEIVHGMPQGMDADDYLVELVNRALAKRKWVGLTDRELEVFPTDFRNGADWAESKLKERNA